jgi:hypothetical protein
MKHQFPLPFPQTCVCRSCCVPTPWHNALKQEWGWAAPGRSLLTSVGPWGDHGVGGTGEEGLPAKEAQGAERNQVVR